LKKVILSLSKFVDMMRFLAELKSMKKIGVIMRNLFSSLFPQSKLSGEEQNANLKCLFLCILFVLCGLIACNQNQKAADIVPIIPVITEPNLTPQTNESRLAIYDRQKDYQLEIEQLRVSNQQWQAKFEAADKRLTESEKSNGDLKKWLILIAGTGIAFLFFAPVRFLSVPLIAGSIFSLVVIQADNRFPMQIALIGIVFLLTILAVVFYQLYLTRKGITEILTGSHQSPSTQKIVAKILEKNNGRTRPQQKVV